MSDGQILRDEIHAGFSPKFNISVSAPGAEDGAGPNAPLTAEPAGGRVWQACLACRRKKIKCDGKQPCHDCSSRDQDCEFPGTKDNASASRYYTTSFESRCQQMHFPSERLETLISHLSRSLEAIHRSPTAGPIASQSDDLMIAAQESVAGLRTFPRVHDTDTTLNSNMHPNRAVAPLCVRQSRVNDELQENSSGSEDSDTNDDDRQNGNAEQREDEHVGQAGALVRDSYGRPRFIGGATHNILVEAAKSLLPAVSTTNSFIHRGEPKRAEHRGPRASSFRPRESVA